MTTPHQQHPAAIRRKWATLSGARRGLELRMAIPVVFEYVKTISIVTRLLAHDYAGARALQAYLRGVGDNE